MNSSEIDNALGLRLIPEDADIIDVEAIEMPETDETGSEVVAYSESYPAVPEPDKEVLEDIDFAKANIKEIIEKGKDSLDELILIAKQTESPRAFEVAANIMKTMLEANKNYIDVSKEKKFEKNDQPSQHVTNVTNNNLVLSTSELLDMMIAKKNG